MSDNKVYKKSIIVESPLLDEEVREQVKDQAREALDESVACAQEQAKDAGKQVYEKAKELAEDAGPARSIL